MRWMFRHFGRSTKPGTPPRGSFTAALNPVYDESKWKSFVRRLGILSERHFLIRLVVDGMAPRYLRWETKAPGRCRAACQR